MCAMCTGQAGKILLKEFWIFNDYRDTMEPHKTSFILGYKTTNAQRDKYGNKIAQRKLENPKYSTLWVPNDSSLKK
jgi:hypothetical protein